MAIVAIGPPNPLLSHGSSKRHWPWPTVRWHRLWFSAGRAAPLGSTAYSPTYRTHVFTVFAASTVQHHDTGGCSRTPLQMPGCPYRFCGILPARNLG